MKVHITQWIGTHDQFRIAVDITTAQRYLRSMHPRYTYGTVRFCAKYASAPDICTTDSYDESTHFNIYCKGGDVKQIIEALSAPDIESRFKPDIVIHHDIELEDITSGGYRK